MNIVNLAEVKTLLQITDQSKDQLIETLIPIVQNDLLTYLNNSFDDGYPSALKLYIANMINYRLQKPKDNVKAESIDDYSVTYNNSSADMIALQQLKII